MHLVRAANLTGILSLIEELGLDRDQLLTASGISIESLQGENVDQYIAMNNIEKLHALIEQQSQQFDLAFRLGSQQEISTLLGVLGFVMQQTKNVAEALAELRHYFSYQIQGASLHLDVQDKYVAIGFIVHEAHRLRSIRYSTEFALAAGVSVLKSLCGESWKPTEVLFEHSAALNPKKLEKYMHAPVRFDRERSVIIFPAKDLEIAVSEENPQLNKILQGYLAQLEEQFTDDPIAQIKQLIQQALITGSCSADKIAAFLGMHRRTLHRHLKDLDTSYSELLDQVRKDTALRMLKQSNVSVTLISEVLCYSELSAFSRAFRSWTNMSPQEFRSGQ